LRISKAEKCQCREIEAKGNQGHMSTCDLHKPIISQRYDLFTIIFLLLCSLI
jgi:hypothetical protein